MIMLMTCQRKPIAGVMASFGKSLMLEGSGKLEDGRVVNVACSCEGINQFACFTVLDRPLASKRL